MTPQSTPAAVFDPARLARLSRGLLMTLRSLSSNRGGDEWTNGVTVGKKLGIQQFYKAFQAWIREMEALPSNLTGAGQSIDIPLASESVDEHGVGVT